jgi:hypothetical protein
MGRYAEAREQLYKARALLDELVAHDPSNAGWRTISLLSHLLEVVLFRQQGDRAGATRLLDDIRPQLEKLSKAEPTDRILARWTVWVPRMKAQLAAAAGSPDAVEAGRRAVELAAKLTAEERMSDADLGECAMASFVMGEIALQAGAPEAARVHWEHAAKLLEPRLPTTRDWRLLDPAARTAFRLGHTAASNAIVTQLRQLGYVPLDPWPNENQLDAPAAVAPQL